MTGKSDRLVWCRRVCLAPGVAAVAIAAAWSVATGQRQDKPFGVIGEDDRKPVMSATWPWTAVGRIHAPKGGRVDFCTGTLVDPKVVATAAHCLHNQLTGKKVRPSSVHFLAGYQKEKYIAHRLAECIKISPGFRFSRKATISLAATDYAFVVLKKPIDVPVVQFYDKDRIARDDHLVHAGYCCDRFYLPSVHDGCRVVERRGNGYLTDCDTAAGASGGPVFVKRDGKYYIAAVQSSSFNMAGGRHVADLSAAASILHERDNLERIKTCE